MLFLGNFNVNAVDCLCLSFFNLNLLFFFALIEAVLVNAEVTALQDIVFRERLPSDPQKNNQTTCEVIRIRKFVRYQWQKYIYRLF